MLTARPKPRPFKTNSKLTHCQIRETVPVFLFVCPGREAAGGAAGVSPVPVGGGRVGRPALHKSQSLVKMEGQASVPRDVFPPTPPGPEGSNGNGLFRVQWSAGAWLLFARYTPLPS